MDDSTKIERERCLQILDAVTLESPPEAQAALCRARNLISTGAEPMTFAEQVGLEGPPVA